MNQMFSLSYRGVNVEQSTYCLEWKDEDGLLHFLFESDQLAYSRLILKAYDEKLTGFIVYPLTRSRQRIDKGQIIKRGRKKNVNALLFSRKVKFDPLEPPENLQLII